MPDQDGDRIITKREDGQYDIQQVSDGERRLARSGVPTLDRALDIARGDLSLGGKIWYRDYRDPPDHLEAA